MAMASSNEGSSESSSCAASQFQLQRPTFRKKHRRPTACVEPGWFGSYWVRSARRSQKHFLLGSYKPQRCIDVALPNSSLRRSHRHRSAQSQGSTADPSSIHLLLPAQQDFTYIERSLGLLCEGIRCRTALLLAVVIAFFSAVEIVRLLANLA